MRLDAAEHVLDVRRDRAVAAEETMAPEEPQIADPRHRVREEIERAILEIWAGEWMQLLLA